MRRITGRALLVLVERDAEQFEMGVFVRKWSTFTDFTRK